MIDQRLDRGKQWLEQVLTLSGVTTTVGTEQPAGAANPANYWLTIDPTSLTPGQKELLIGANGATIDAIQYLANASLNIHAEPDLQAGYTIELDGYVSRDRSNSKPLPMMPPIVSAKRGKRWYCNQCHPPNAANCILSLMAMLVTVIYQPRVAVKNPIDAWL